MRRVKIEVGVVIGNGCWHGPILRVERSPGGFAELIWLADGGSTDGRLACVRPAEFGATWKVLDGNNWATSRIVPDFTPDSGDHHAP